MTNRLALCAAVLAVSACQILPDRIADLAPGPARDPEPRVQKLASGELQVAAGRTCTLVYAAIGTVVAARGDCSIDQRAAAVAAVNDYLSKQPPETGADI